MKSDETPDYSVYSLNQLLDIAAHVNREKFPDRFQAVQLEIKKQQNQPQLKTMKTEAERRAISKGVFDGLSLGFAFFCFTGVAATYSLVDGIQPDYFFVFLMSVIFGVVSGFIFTGVARRKNR